MEWIAHQIVDRTGRGKRPGIGAQWRPNGLDDYFIDLTGNVTHGSGSTLFQAGNCPAYGDKLIRRL